MRAARLLVRLVTAAAITVAALAVSGVAAAGGGGGSLALAVSPGVLAPGGSGTITATFTNTGNSTLTHVVVDVSLAGGTFDLAGSSAACAATASGASCSLGNVGSGGVVTSTIAFTAGGNGPWEFDGTATWNAASVGNPKGAAASKDTATASTTASSVVPAGATVLALNTGCAADGDSVAAGTEDEGISTQASTPPDNLSCTPITDGVTTDPNGGDDILFTKLPATPEPVNVTLTFADENLPFSGDHAQQPLMEYPNFPDLTTQVTVPFCVYVEDVPTIPSGSDSCILSVNTDDPIDEDADMGTVDLLVQPNGNDPGYH